MKHVKRNFLLSSLPAIAATASGSGHLTATIEIPQLNVAEYHRPYVAAWIESESRQVVADVSVWYDTEMKDREGETWLKDLRQWWRKSGRSLEMPVDGVSGPTRPVGTHEITADLSKLSDSNLQEGDYYFVVEASREVGGREMLRIPFSWNKSRTVDASLSGERELGKITLKIER